MRISGVNLPKEKNISIALTYIVGNGRKLSLKILKELNINPLTKVQDLSEAETSKLREKISHIPTEGELRQKVNGTLLRCGKAIFEKNGKRKRICFNYDWARRRLYTTRS